MLWIVQENIRNGISHAIHQYVKANNKCVKDYDRLRSYFKYWGVYNVYGWAMLHTLPLGSFKWVENTSQLSKDFVENSNKDTDEGYFHEVDL